MITWSMIIAYLLTKAKKTQLEYVISFFHYNNGCTNAPQYYVIRTLSVLFTVCPVYSLSCLLSVLFTVCPVYCLSCLLSVLFTVCPVYLA